MKKFDGMMPPTFVFADEGKNGDCGPPPSPAIVSGAVSGLTMRSAGCGCAFTHTLTASGKIRKRDVTDGIAAGRVHPTPVRWQPDVPTEAS